LQCRLFVDDTVGLGVGFLVGNTGQVKYHINTLEKLSRGKCQSKINRLGGRAIGQGSAGFTQGNDRVAARKQLLAKVAPDIPGRSTNKTFHAVGSPSKEKGAKSPLMIRMPLS
jgi:hypothetical protein